ARRDARHHHRPKPRLTCLHDGGSAFSAGFDQLVEVRQQNNAFHDGNAKQGNKANGRRDAERGAGEQERENAADHRHRNDRDAEKGVGQRGEIDVQQYANEQDRQGDDHLEPRDCVLQVAKLAGPFQSVAWRQLHLLGNLALGVDHGAAKIAAANAELDRDVALLLFAIDEGRTGYQVDGRDLTQRYLRDLVRSWVLHRDGQTADRLYVLPVLRSQSNDQREVPVAALLVEVTCRLPADGGLHRRIDVAGRQPIARGSLSVDIDAERGLAQRGEHREINHAAHLAHRVFDLLGGFRQQDNVVTDQLDRVLAFDAGYRFLDVVLNVLREVEADAGKLRLQSLVHLLDELVFGQVLAPLLFRLEGREKFGIEEAGSIRAVVGPALLGYDRLDFGKV